MPADTYPLGGSEQTAYEAQAIPLAIAPTPTDLGHTWFFSRGGTHEGPVTYEDLQRMAAQGEIGPDTLVWKSGMANWVPCRQISGFAFSGQSIPSTPPAPALHQPYYGSGLPPYSNVVPRTSGLAIASLVLGILYLCGIGSLLATIFGAVALGQISRSNGAVTGKGMAIAGFVLGIIGLGFIAFLFFAGMLGDIADTFRHRRL
jgi:hypothetical protein